MAKTVKLTAPLTDQDVLQLNIGDTVLVSGVRAPLPATAYAIDLTADGAGRIRAIAPPAGTLRARCSRSWWNRSLPRRTAS